MPTVNFTEKRQRFLDILNEVSPGAVTVTRKQIVAIVRGTHKGQIGWPAWLTDNKALRAGRGEYTIPVLVPRTTLAGVTPVATSEPVSAS